MCYFKCTYTKEGIPISKKDFLPPVAECHCLNLRRLTLQTIEQYDQYVRPAGITIQQFSLMRHLHFLSPISVTELAEAMGLDRTTLSRNLKVLEKKGLVCDDLPIGRQRQLMLSQEGRRVFAQAEALWQKAQHSFEDRLGPERMAQLNEILQLLLTNPEEK